MKIESILDTLKEYYIGKQGEVCLITDVIENTQFIVKLPNILKSNELVKRELIELVVKEIVWEVYCNNIDFYLVFDYNNTQYKIELYLL